MTLCDPAEHWTDLLGLTDYDVFLQELADGYYRLEKQVFAGLPVAHEVQRILGKDGRAGWVDNRKYPIRNDSGEIVDCSGWRATSRATSRPSRPSAGAARASPAERLQPR